MTSHYEDRLMAVRRTRHQNSGSSPSPWSCAFSILTQSHPGVYTPKQIPASDPLHKLQPMAIRDQPVGLNIVLLPKLPIVRSVLVIGSAYIRVLQW